MPNGNEKWFQAIIKIIYNKKGDAVMMHGTSQDVTELHSSRHLLEERELRLKMALQIAQLGSWEENHKTGKMYWSSILRKMFKIDKNIKMYLDQKLKDEENVLPENDNCRYYKLPYLGRISEYTEKKLKQLIKRFCKKGTSIKIGI